jgi:uncharacterized coiled-coil protein SlyX
MPRKFDGVIVAFPSGKTVEDKQTVATGGGGGTGDGMDARVAVLETHMSYVRSDLNDIKMALAENSKALGKLSDDVKELPTKKDLWEWKLQWTIISLAAVAIIVGGIIGGVDWIKTH